MPRYTVTMIRNELPQGVYRNRRKQVVVDVAEGTPLATVRKIAIAECRERGYNFVDVTAHVPLQYEDLPDASEWE